MSHLLDAAARAATELNRNIGNPDDYIQPADLERIFQDLMVPQGPGAVIEQLHNILGVGPEDSLVDAVLKILRRLGEAEGLVNILRPKVAAMRDALGIHAVTLHINVELGNYYLCELCRAEGTPASNIPHAETCLLK